MKLNNFVSVNVCFSTRDTIPSTKGPRPPSQTLHSEEKTEVPVGLEDKRSHFTLVCEEPPNHVQTSTVSNFLIICKYVEMILRVCLVRTVLKNEILFHMIDNRFLCCATLI